MRRTFVPEFSDLAKNDTNRMIFKEICSSEKKDICSELEFEIYQ